MLPEKPDTAESRWWGVGETRGEEETTSQEQSMYTRPMFSGAVSDSGRPSVRNCLRASKVAITDEIVSLKNPYAEAPTSECDRIWRQSLKR